MVVVTEKNIPKYKLDIYDKGRMFKTCFFTTEEDMKKTKVFYQKNMGMQVVISTAVIEWEPFVNEQLVNEVWEDCLECNSYTHMGCGIQFDTMADMVIGEGWHMRNQAESTIRAVSKLMTPARKIEVMSSIGVHKDIIAKFYTIGE